MKKQYFSDTFFEPKLFEHFSKIYSAEKYLYFLWKKYIQAAEYDDTYICHSRRLLRASWHLVRFYWKLIIHRPLFYSRQRRHLYYMHDIMFAYIIVIELVRKAESNS